MTTFWPKRDKDGRHIRSTANPTCKLCKGFVRYYTFDYKKGVYITNYCEHG